MKLSFDYSMHCTNVDYRMHKMHEWIGLSDTNDHIYIGAEVNLTIL